LKIEPKLWHTFDGLRRVIFISVQAKAVEGYRMKKPRASQPEQIMTLREVARYLGLHVMTVYKLTREGRVPAAKIGGQWRFKRDVLDEWLETQMHRHTT
jgi:excisionase family DNA binding protein